MNDRPRVAFVDDESRVLSGLRRSLRTFEKDWDLSFHDDPKAALASFLLAPPNVAVLDIRMLEMSGLQLARALRERHPETQCLVLSGSTDFDVAVASINEGHIFRYYVKPCATEDLVAGIETALANRRRRRTDKPDLPLVDDPVHAERISQVALELVPYGVIVTDAEGRALFANARAGQLLSRGHGIRLDGSGRCRANHPEDTRRLYAALGQACREGTTSALTLESEDASPLRLTVQPYRAEGADAARRVGLFIFSDDTLRSPEPKLLMEMFGLTLAEARLAAALTRGLSLEEGAAECGIKTASARTYLKPIFAKLGVSRQAELVRTILTSLAVS